MSAEGRNNLLLTILRGFLILVLALPVTPSLASLTSAGVSGAVNENHPEKMQMNSQNSNTPLAEKGSMNQDHAVCKKENHRDDTCNCKTCNCKHPCQQLSASASPTFLTTQENASHPRLDRAEFAFQFEISPLKNQYLPALPPPIS